MGLEFSKILGFKCISCGREIEKAEYTCPECSGNMDVVYDYKKIAKFFSKKDLVKNRDFSIWRYSPILPVTSLRRIPSLQIGVTSLCSIRRLNDELGIENLLFKDDTKLPSASLKDRASAVTVVVGLEKGKEIFTTASTGNAGCALACISANMGLKSIIFVPKSAPKAKIAQLLLYGARVIAVNGTYDDAYDLSLKASERFGWYNRSTGYNPFTREGKKTASLEIAEQMSWEVPDYVFVPVGDGNIISGIWKGFVDLYELEFIKKLPKLVAVQSDKSDSVTRSYENAVSRSQESKDIKIIPVKATTVADSIFVDLPRDGVAAVKAIMESGGGAVRVSDDEILKTIKYLAEKTGIFAEPAGVTSFAGFLKMFKERKVHSASTVVCLITGNGLKDIDSALKVSGSPETIDPQISELEKIVRQ
ncbi:MAG: threonine synthase [Candidatus Eisenbacteria bacterium]|nr:threonine synthase [Candidatus Eisenbacteria bacterium]